MTAPKVVMIGLDSMTPVMIERFLADGTMPNLARLQKAGWWAEVVPTMPPTTPAGWATIATGAWPSTHGVEGFAVHRPGDPLDRKTHSLYSDTVNAEFIWQAAERAGKHTILLKYPLSWPPTKGTNLVQVDGAGGWGGLKCVWDLTHSGCWDTHAELPTRHEDDAMLSEEWLTRDSDTIDEETVQRLVIQEPSETWKGLAPNATPLWETTITLRAANNQYTTVFVLVMDIQGEDRLIISPDRNGAGHPYLAAGDWSPWIHVQFRDIQETHAGHVRFKVMALSASDKQLRLYQTQIHNEAGFTWPKHVADNLLEVAGPFVEWTESYERLKDWIDDATQMEIYEQHVSWMERATRYLMENHPWDLFMTQLHIIDMAYHLYWGAVDSRHPQYDPARAPEFWKLLQKTHALADEFLGNVVEMAGPDTLVVVCGDHGQDLYHTGFLINHHLIKQGWLAIARDPRTGNPQVDWKHTKAYAIGYRIYLNVLGRDPQGYVRDSDYKPLQEEIIRSLYAVEDPRTGNHPIRIAMPQDDAKSIGLYGRSMGDIVMAMASGYQARGTISVPPDAWLGRHVQVESLTVFRATDLLREFSGDHDTSFPFNRAIHTMLYLAGPGIRPGHAEVPIRMVDIAPTMCRYLHIPMPLHSEGNVLAGVLEE